MTTSQITLRCCASHLVILNPFSSEMLFGNEIHLTNASYIIEMYLAVEFYLINSGRSSITNRWKLYTSSI